MTTWIALLRGINVGGNKKVKMAELREMLSGLGMEAPQTLLQSGNAVFRSPETDPRKLEDLLEAETEKQLGVKCDFLLRTSTQWDKIVAANPFPEEAKSDPSHLLVVVGKVPFDAGRVAEVQAGIRGPEQLKVAGDCLYITFPDGIGTSKLVSAPAYGKLTARGTGRNWNTVLKLAAMTRAAD
jgi:uncharacterized protein (DUF1697 family)